MLTYYVVSSPVGAPYCIVLDAETASRIAGTTGSVQVRSVGGAQARVLRGLLEGS